MVIAVVVFFGFTKHIPFKQGYRIKAVFVSASTSAQVAGADRRGHVGKVSSIKREGSTGVVTMEIEPSRPADPLRRDRSRSARGSSWKATSSSNCSPAARRRTRSPRAPRSRSRRRPTRSSSIRCWTALNSDTRANLQDFLIGYGAALTRKPTAAENAEQYPDVRGLNGAQALNKSYRRGPAALRGGAIVNQAVGGTDRTTSPSCSPASKK